MKRLMWAARRLALQNKLRLLYAYEKEIEVEVLTADGQWIREMWSV